MTAGKYLHEVLPEEINAIILGH